MPDLSGGILNNRYHVVTLLGRGGMAEVYKAWDQQRSVFLAMKLLREDLSEDRIFLRRFKREAQTLSQLQHPNIVRFYGLEQDGPLAFILMDFVEGITLRREIFESHGPIRPERVREIMGPVCAALHYAHTQGFIHCDIKPGNILIDENGRVQITDFGIARLSESATATMVGLGSPAYMAPEQIYSADPTPQTDIYSLGVVLYEMVTGGERPFTGERARTTGSTSEKVRYEHLHLQPPSPRRFNTDLDPEFEAVILKCLEKKPENRFASAIQLLNAIETTISGQTQDEALPPVMIPAVDVAETALPATTLAAPPIQDETSLGVIARLRSQKKSRLWWLIGVGFALLVLIVFVFTAGDLINPISGGLGGNNTVTAPTSLPPTETNLEFIAPVDSSTPSPSPTPTRTKTPTSTFTPSPSPTRTLTATPTHTVTLTPTPTYTYVPLPTPTSTKKPKPKPKPKPTNTLAPPGSYPSP